jgi:hypothetical protein
MDTVANEGEEAQGCQSLIGNLVEVCVTRGSNS